MKIYHKGKYIGERLFNPNTFFPISEKYKRVDEKRVQNVYNKNI